MHPFPHSNFPLFFLSVCTPADVAAALEHPLEHDGAALLRSRAASPFNRHHSGSSAPPTSSAGAAAASPNTRSWLVDYDVSELKRDMEALAQCLLGQGLMQRLQTLLAPKLVQANPFMAAVALAVGIKVDQLSARANKLFVYCLSVLSRLVRQTRDEYSRNTLLDETLQPLNIACVHAESRPLWFSLNLAPRTAQLCSDVRMHYMIEMVSSDYAHAPIELFKILDKKDLPRAVAINSWDSRFVAVAPTVGLRELNIVATSK